MDLVQYIGSIGGIAGVLAFIMFQTYRQDRKYMEGRMTELIREYNENCRASREVLNELIVWLKARNGNK